MSDVLIKLENIEKSYTPGEPAAVRNLNLEVMRGSFSTSWPFRLRQKHNFAPNQSLN